MKFSVYTLKNVRLVPLYRINRTPAGLYFNNVSGGGPSYTTYHEDGAYWGRVGHAKAVKKRREPLSSLIGPYTLSTMTGTILAPRPGDRKAADVQLRAEDIVVDLPNPFGAEIIISAQEVTLEPLPDRVDSQVFVKSNLTPIILTFEFFGNPTNTLQVGRFPSPPIYKMTFEANERI